MKPQPNVASRVLQMFMEYRRLIVIAIHLAMVVASYYLALWLRFDGVVPPDLAAQARHLLPALVLIRAVTFIPFRLYEGLWRYTSIRDARNIVGAVATSSLLFFVVIRLVFGANVYPRSVYIIDAVLLIGFLVGVRSIRRLVRELNRSEHGRRVLVFGAGDAGEMIVRDMKRRGFYHGEPIGFIDDDRRKVGQRIHGVSVLGTRADVPGIIEREKPDDVLIAMPAADPATIRTIVKVLEPYNLPIKTLPNLRDVLDGRVSVSQIRELAIEDLLPRAPVGLDATPIRDLIGGKSVLVTGAGGSIGSELCRQIMGFGPRKLVLFERYENSLFAIENDLRDRLRSSMGPQNGSGTGVPPVPTIHAVIGDMTDRRRVNDVFARHRPDIVFHAAAHKHVPLMEASPCEAVKNNVGGTWVLARAAVRYGVSRFVMISTDKAVNPTSVMGATKRVCELIVQGLATGSDANGTRFGVVRFGNVLGSNGSVIPRFVEQIKSGGPVTVTHPDIRRFFMLIPEAVVLVLHAATVGEAGEVLVLDMGEQIKVVDVARNLIRLSGFIPNEDIPIVFTGLRPGEKLYEELLGDVEDSEPSGVEKVIRIRRRSVSDVPALEQRVLDLVRLARRGDDCGVLAKLREVVPTYRTPGVEATIYQDIAADQNRPVPV
ncbi:MAG TPA: nucleoside-diphosphate sugar epimerase/dehydratase [Vicinamibacterales bacterium]|jgi:FlaA1/EpsC-like NDP-sugar epimerase